MYTFIALTQRLKLMKPVRGLAESFTRITLASVESLDIPPHFGAILLYVNDWRGGAKRSHKERKTRRIKSATK